VLRVGLTGGTGAGKSTVATRLAAHGAVVVDADALAREVVAPGSDGLAAVVAEFGPSVLAADGGLDRARLGQLVFADTARRRELERITHPRIAVRTAELLAAAPADAVVVHDVPLLVEKRMGAAYHLVLVVDAAEEVRLDRLVRLRGMRPDDARARVAAQASDDERRAAADVLLDNSGALDRLVAAVDAVWDERLVPFEENVRLRRPATGPAADLGDPVLVARLGARVARAAGAPGSAVDVVDGALRLTVTGAAADLVEALAEAGFPPCPGPAGPGRYGSADPGCVVGLAVTARGDGTARGTVGTDAYR
jgi:dephospho-CoA kinase